jgi:hypothetical protein
MEQLRVRVLAFNFLANSVNGAPMGASTGRIRKQSLGQHSRDME